jgi:Fe-S-cluster-containing hydrogenase component 2
MTKGSLLFGRRAYAVGDALRIGEGTSAVLRGKQAAYEILEDMGVRFNYDEYLAISKEYIDSQQHPVRVIKEPYKPSRERAEQKPYVIIDCLYGFACNPCEFACPHGAITKTSTSTVPSIDYDKCIGCMDCVYQCPGLAIFGYAEKKNWLFLPIEYSIEEGAEVYLVDNNGKVVG